jgi:hypothetical protein
VTVRLQRLFRWPLIASICGIRVVVLPLLPPLAETSLALVISDEVAAVAFGLCEEHRTLIDLLRHRSHCALFHCLLLIFWLFGPKNKKKNKKLKSYLLDGCRFLAATFFRRAVVSRYIFTIHTYSPSCGFSCLAVFGFARRKAARGPAVDAPLPHN